MNIFVFTWTDVGQKSDVLVALFTINLISHHHHHLWMRQSMLPCSDEAPPTHIWSVTFILTSGIWCLSKEAADEDVMKLKLVMEATLMFGVNAALLGHGRFVIKQCSLLCSISVTYSGKYSSYIPSAAINVCCWTDLLFPYVYSLWPCVAFRCTERQKMSGRRWAACSTWSQIIKWWSRHKPERHRTQSRTCDCIDVWHQDQTVFTRYRKWSNMIWMFHRHMFHSNMEVILSSHPHKADSSHQRHFSWHDFHLLSSSISSIRDACPARPRLLQSLLGWWKPEETERCRSQFDRKLVLIHFLSSPASDCCPPRLHHPLLRAHWCWASSPAFQPRCHWLHLVWGCHGNRSPHDEAPLHGTTT